MKHGKNMLCGSILCMCLGWSLPAPVGRVLEQETSQYPSDTFTHTCPLQ